MVDLSSSQRLFRLLAFGTSATAACGPDRNSVAEKIALPDEYLRGRLDPSKMSPIVWGLSSREPLRGMGD